MGIWSILLGWILFAGTHIGLSAQPVRRSLISKTGEKGFQGLYSLIALLTFAFLILMYVLTDKEGTGVLVSGDPAAWLVHVSSFLMLLAIILLFTGFANPSPLGIVAVEPKARGIIRVTRHPVNMAFALFGLAHILTAKFVVEWIFYLGFLVYGILGALHQDRKKIQQQGEGMKAFIESTSLLPFLAIVSGKQQFKFSEISKLALLLAIVVTVVIRVLHPAVRQQLF